MKNLFFIIPFLFFVTGYYALAWLTQVHTVQVPSVVGMSLTQAVMSLSEQQLNVRVLAFHEEPDIEPGTIISQIPTAGSSSKPQQRVFVVIAKEPAIVQAPGLMGISIEQAQQVAKQQGLQLKQVAVTSSIYPHNMVIAQAPAPGEQVKDKTITTYVCNDTQRLVIMPDFAGLSLATVKQFCEQQNVTLEAMYASPRDERYGVEQCRVKHQRPLAGSLLDLNKPLKVQISIAV